MQSIMRKLEYKNPPHYDEPEKYRDYLSEVSNHSCIYCTLTEDENLGATFNIDHFKPKSIFPSLYSECENLRYSCPRCNSYKRAKWISVEDGCSRNCKTCKSRVCKTYIPRFIDCLSENPSDFIEMDSKQLLQPKHNSPVGCYTIDTLRLNRDQLIRMRELRTKKENLRQSVVNYRDIVEQRRKKINERKNRFLEWEKGGLNENDDKLASAVECLFELLSDIEEADKEIIEYIEKQLDY